MSGRFDEDIHVNGTLSAEDMALPAGCVDDDAVSGAAAIASTKLVHRHKSAYSEKSTVECAAATVCLAGMIHAGKTLAFEVGVHTLMSAGGGDNKTVTFDLQKQTGVSVLLAAITIDKTKTAKTLYPATILTEALADGDTLWAVVTVGGDTGTQAKGMFACVTIEENPT